MLLLDVNVVLAMHRQDHPQHSPVRAWFDQVVENGEDFGVPLTVWGSFLRITTNRRVFKVPTPLHDAFTFIDALRGQPGHIQLEPGIRHLVLLQRIAERSDAYGDLVPDVVLAAIAAEAGAKVASLDRDFARIADIEVVRPVQ
ncbi:type II toxin-antitoxin system VapC family toxin [Yimella sp. cx-51]|nr:type II toxin-antitoxin system VapC family toxin [Yimella sp. cx-51]MBD2760485.1 type II toxin-antitoxin system VapC family toxin [Yimella sp. cx-573]